jgi:hypothetical protein
LLSHRRVSTEDIALLVGHATTRTTEIVYRREPRPVINPADPARHHATRPIYQPPPVQIPLPITSA